MLTIQHVLIALDADARAGGALDVLALLLQEADAEVLGLFVEDEDVARLASLPIAREVRVQQVHAGAPLPLSRGDVDRAWRDQAEQLRGAFERRLSALRVRHTFEVRRGSPARTIVDAARSTQFVIVERCARAGVRFWATLPQLSELTHLPVLFVNEPWATGSSVLLVGDGDGESDGALPGEALAAEFAARDGLPLVVARSTPLHSGRRSGDAGGAAAASGDAARPTKGVRERSTRVLPHARRSDPDALLALAHEADARLLVLPRAAVPDLSRLLPVLLRRLECSLLIA
jgi:hypothetical protein